MALQFTEREFIPVLLGGDINAYSVARAFYEEYQVKSLVFGKYQTGPAYRSQIIDYTPNVDIDTMPVIQHKDEQGIEYPQHECTAYSARYEVLYPVLLFSPYTV